jgi:hypothetical protein
VAGTLEGRSWRGGFEAKMEKSAKETARSPVTSNKVYAADDAAEAADCVHKDHQMHTASDVAPAGLPPHVSVFTRIMTRWPVTVAAIFFSLIMCLIAGVGIPDFQQGFDGYDARRSF